MATSDHVGLIVLNRAMRTRSVREVARAVGVSPATISLVSRSQYTGDTVGVLERVIATFAGSFVYTCPHTGQTITAQHCANARADRAPTHNPARMAAWVACQRCTVVDGG